MWSRIRSNPGYACQSVLFWIFWFSLASYPVAYLVRRFIPVIALPFLLGYYYFCWRESVLARLPIRWLFLCLFGMVVIGIVFSCNVEASWLHVRRNFYKGLLLPFIAMECVRDGKDLRRLTWAMAIACFWEGLDGVWQAWTGADFIHGFPLNAGRLTGSLGDYPIGNYIALALVPAWGIWHLLRERLTRPASAMACAVLLGPGLFLLNGAATRSGMLSLACGMGLWCLFQARGLSGKFVLRACTVFVLIFACFIGGQYLVAPKQSARFTIETVSRDGRWGFWQTAIGIFREYPVFGSGAGTFRETFERLDIAPKFDVRAASHPHDLYLDILYAHGIVGFALGMCFLLGAPWWAFRQIVPRMRKELLGAQVRSFWRLAFCFWLGYVSWLINGIFGHNFYRVWYLGLAMCFLGIVLGAVVNGMAGEKEGKLAFARNCG